MGSAGHSSLLGVIVLVGECCFVVGWVCLVGVDGGVYQKEGSFGHFEPPFCSRCSLVNGLVRTQVLRVIFLFIVTHRHSHHYSRITILTRDYYY